VGAAVAEIRRLTLQAQSPLRYRDIAIIVRDLDEYHDLLSASLRAGRIPFFIDRRQPTTNHPLIELIRGLLAVAGDDCRLESVRLTLKTGLLPIDNDDADLLENYLLAHGIVGWEAWQQAWSFTRMFKRRDRDAPAQRDSQGGSGHRVNRTARDMDTICRTVARRPGRTGAARSRLGLGRCPAVWITSVSESTWIAGPSRPKQTAAPTTPTATAKSGRTSSG